MAEENSGESQKKEGEAEQAGKNLEGFVDGPRLLEILFPNEKCRPTVRWLRKMTKKRAVPFLKMGRMVYFNPGAVVRSLEERFALRPRGA